jgi:hypothetical protein
MHGAMNVKAVFLCQIVSRCYVKTALAVMSRVNIPRVEGQTSRQRPLAVRALFRLGSVCCSRPFPLCVMQNGSTCALQHFRHQTTGRWKWQ